MNMTRKYIHIVRQSSVPIRISDHGVHLGLHPTGAFILKIDTYGVSVWSTSPSKPIHRSWVLLPNTMHHWS